MDTRPGRDREQGRRSSWRRWGALLGGLALFVLAFELVERLAAPEEQLPAAMTAAEDAGPAPEPVQPEITTLEDGSVMIRIGEAHRTVIRFEGEPGKTDALVSCLTEGVERSFVEGDAGNPPAASGWLAGQAHRKQAQEEMLRIQNDCLATTIHRRPTPPLPPPPPAPPQAG